ncbi:hypothetical protein E4U58_006802 [Claviceps cyperi]|nr:hypothetical protein E4U58_006802 [Claviceps cyperi]
MRFCDLFTSLLLGISVTSVALASPFDSEGDSQVQDRAVILDARALRVLIVKGPREDATCPYRAKAGNFGPYFKHKFTKKLIESAFNMAANYAATGEKVGDHDYPHDFGNDRKLPFPCGVNKMVYPIHTNNHPYSSGSSDDIPDRVVFDYRKTKWELIVRYCGVMRHGVGRDLLKCT